MEGYNSCYVRRCALCTFTPFDTQCLIVRKAFAVASRATTNVSRTCTVPSARPSRRYLQGAFMAGGRFHDPTLYLLRTYVRTSHSSPITQTTGQLGQLAIPASPPYAIGTRPSLAQGTPKRPSHQVHCFFARL